MRWERVPSGRQGELKIESRLGFLQGKMALALITILFSMEETDTREEKSTFKDFISLKVAPIQSSRV